MESLDRDPTLLDYFNTFLSSEVGGSRDARVASCSGGQTHRWQDIVTE